jgi:hypothetical protein
VCLHRHAAHGEGRCTLQVRHRRQQEPGAVRQRLSNPPLPSFEKVVKVKVTRPSLHGELQGAL